jgi:hypothetical protein
MIDDERVQHLATELQLRESRGAFYALERKLKHT